MRCLACYEGHLTQPSYLLVHHLFRVSLERGETKSTRQATTRAGCADTTLQPPIHWRTLQRSPHEGNQNSRGLFYLLCCASQASQRDVSTRIKQQYVRLTVGTLHGTTQFKKRNTSRREDYPKTGQQCVCRLSSRPKNRAAVCLSSVVTFCTLTTFSSKYSAVFSVVITSPSALISSSVICLHSWPCRRQPSTAPQKGQVQRLKCIRYCCAVMPSVVLCA